MNKSDNARAKTALVTGASGALGRSVIKAFTGARYRVIGTDVGSIPAEVTAQIDWVQADLADSKNLKKNLSPFLSSIDVVVHCAGGFRFGQVAEFTDADLDFLISANIKSSFTWPAN